MKKLKEFINRLITCVGCTGLGYIELGSSGTKPCTACKGKGFL